MSLDILNLCVGIIFSFIDIYLMKCYIPHSINTNINRTIFYLVETLVFIPINLTEYWHPFWYLILIIFAIVYYIYIYKIDFKIYIKNILLFFKTRTIIELALIPIFEWIFDLQLIILNLNTSLFYYLFIKIVARYIMYIIANYLLLFSNNKKPKQLYSFKMVSIIFSIYFSIFILTYNNKIYYFTSVGRTFTFMIIIYLFALIAFNKYQTVHEILERDMLQTNERILAEKRFIERKVEADENIKRMRHDLKNYYHILNGYANDGNIEEIKKFLETRIGILDKSSSFIHSGHSCIDSILNEKIFVMKEKNIQYTENLANMYIGNIDVSDLSLLIGLALDNAIEAAEQVNDFKEIEFTAKNYQGYLVLYFKNSIISNSHPDFNKTSKLSDSFNHGFGVKGIKQFAKIYNGEMKYITEKDKVILRVTLSVSNG